MSEPHTSSVERQPSVWLRAGMMMVAGFVAACGAPSPGPRTFYDFMEDGLAREGVLARCNQDRAVPANDLECANARRAEAVVALERERKRAAELERESARKLAAVGRRQAQASTDEAQLRLEARAAAEAAYEAQWSGATARPAKVPGPTAPAFGAPLGSPLPSIAESALFDVYASGAATFGPPTLELAAAEPPSNEMAAFVPELALDPLDALPRPFRNPEAATVTP